LRQRETDGSWGGLWEFPWGFEHDDLAAEEVLMKEIDKVLGTASFTLRSLGRVRHSIMNTQIDLNGYVASLPSLVHVETPFKWVMPKELSKLPLQGGSAKLLHLFIKKSRPSSIKGLPHEDI
jgi:adenine-specific DNA glycosylase